MAESNLFQAAPQQSKLQKFGEMLGGFGAGVQGKGPEYIAAIQERRADEEKKRLAAMVKDAKTAYDFINRGDVNNAMSLIQDRVQMINELGGDPSDTARIGSMLQSGRIAEAQNELRGFLRPFMPIETVKAADVIDGQRIITDPLTGETRAEPIEGFTRDTASTSPASFRALQLQAEAAGIPEGSEEYQNFMRYGGASGQVGGSGSIRYNNGTVVQYLGSGRIKVLDPIQGEITDPAAKEEALKLAIASKPAEAGAIAAAQEQAKGQEGRAQGIINQGQAAADSTAVLRRSLALLDRVQTGGFNRVALATRKLFGVEGADEGELSANLGKAVLSQLRATFGAAFTAKEGESLKEIEAGFGSSVDTNKRLLNNALAIAENSAQKAIRRAELRGDYETADEIEAALQFNLADIEAEFAEQEPPAVQGTTPAAGRFVYDPETKTLIPQGQ